MFSTVCLPAADASSDVFLYPSVTEGWGATCLEAQASGLPVVATNSSGIFDVVANGIGGVDGRHRSTEVAMSESKIRHR